MAANCSPCEILLMISSMRTPTPKVADATTPTLLTMALTNSMERLMHPDDTKVHDMSATFIRAILWMFPAMSIMRGSNAFIQGIGNAKLSMVLALLDGVVLRIGLSWLFGIVLDWGFFGFVLGYGLAPYGCAVPGMIYFLSGVWQRRKVLAEDI